MVREQTPLSQKMKNIFVNNIVQPQRDSNKMQQDTHNGTTGIVRPKEITSLYPLPLLRKNLLCILQLYILIYICVHTKEQFHYILEWWEFENFPAQELCPLHMSF